MPLVGSFSVNRLVHDRVAVVIQAALENKSDELPGFFSFTLIIFI